MAMMAEDLAGQMQCKADLKAANSCYKTQSAMMTEDLAGQMQCKADLKEANSCYKTQSGLLTEKVKKLNEDLAKVKRKLKWHEDVRDCVSAAIRTDWQQNDAVPLVPQWLLLEGHHIDSESE